MPRRYQLEANAYAGLTLDRATERRSDETWVASLLQAEGTRVLPMLELDHVVTESAPLDIAPLSVRDLQSLGATDDAFVLLGVTPDERAVFTADLGAITSAGTLDGLLSGRRLEGLRALTPTLSTFDASLLGYARAMLYWRSRHRRCGVCGGETVSRAAGHRLACADDTCGATYHPRIDPAVIMLVHDGGDRCVLASGSRHVGNRRSVLAGFVEPGESLEEAVAREVMEEVGLPVGDVEYRSSQPWPFPGSIMLGFRARAQSLPLQPDLNELRVADWYGRREIADHLASGALALPGPDAIARRLLDDWLAEGGVRLPDAAETAPGRGR